MATQAEVELVINASNALPQVLRELRNIVAQAEGTAPEIDLDTSVSVRQTIAQVNRAVNAAQRAAPDVNVRVDADTDQAATGLAAFRRTVQSSVSSLGGLASAAGAVARPLALVSAGVTGVGAAAGAVLPVLAGATAALESMAPAAAVATTALVAVGLAGAALTIGMQGVGEAIENAFDPETKPEDLAASLEALAPSAREFVLELSSMRDGLRDLRLDVQDRLFQDLDGSLSSLAQNVLPQVQGALNETATTLNRMATSTATAASELGTSGTLGRALDSATAGLENLVDLPAQLTTGFGQLAAAAGPSFERITAAAGRAATGVAESLGDAFESGRLEAAIDAGVDAVAQFGRAVGNIFGAVGNIFEATAATGATFLDSLERITGVFEDATGTEEFQNAIRELVQTMSAVSEQTAPLFAQALSTVAKVIGVLGPVARRLVEALGPALLGVLEAAEAPLVALAGAFGVLVDALGPLIETAGTLIADLMPSLTPLFETLGSVIETMAPFIEQLAQNFAVQLTPILERLPEILAVILPLFEQAANEIFPALTEILADVTPDLEAMATTLADLAVQLAPVIAKFLEFSIALTAKIIPFIGPVLTSLFEALAFVIDRTAAAVKLFIGPLTTLGNLLTGDFTSAVEATGLKIQDFKDLATNAFNLLVGDAVKSLGRLASDVGKFATRAGDSLLKGIQSGIDKTIEFLGRLPSLAANALSNVGTALVSSGSALIQGFLDGISSKIGQVRAKLSELTSLLPDWKGPMDLDKRILAPSGAAVIDGFMDGIESRLPDLRTQLGGITATIPSSVGRVAPAVAPVLFVSIGNEAVDQFVTTRVRQETQAQTRTLAQGIRR